MSIDATSGTSSQTNVWLDWQPPEPPTNLVFDDGEPLETHRHRIAMNVLIDSALQALQHRSDIFVGGNMFVYYSRDQAMNRDFRGPDFFVAFGVDSTRERQGWVVWEENGRYPNVIVELMSPSTAKTDLNEKKILYEQTFRTADYFVYDPFEPNSLQGWHLDVSSGYQPLSPSEKGWLWCESLKLWLGPWDGQIQREPPTGTCSWLRFYDSQGYLVPLSAEAAEDRVRREQKRAQQAEEQLQDLLDRLNAKGIDPNQL